MLPYNPSGQYGQILSISAATEDEADNALYSFRFTSSHTASVSGSASGIEYIHEYDAGSNDSSAPNNLSLPFQQPTLFTLTRNSAGTGLSFYINGELSDTDTL